MTHNLFKWSATALTCLVLFAGCGKESDGVTKLPARQTIEAFNAQFPDATDVQWSKKRGYDVATFGLTTRASATTPRNSVWYPEGSTNYTYTQFEITWAELQRQAPAVAQAWSESNYKAQGYLLDDIDVKNYADAAPVYKLEIELRGVERELVYKADGVLLSDQQDMDSDNDQDEDGPSPQTILNFIAANLSGATIVDTDTEREGGKLFYEVEVRVGGEEKELIFDEHENFLYIQLEIDDHAYQNTLPKAVYTKFLSLAPDTEDWDDVYIRQGIRGDVIGYVLTVENQQTDRETTYVVDAQGNVLP